MLILRLLAPGIPSDTSIIPSFERRQKKKEKRSMKPLTPFVFSCRSCKIPISKAKKCGGRTVILRNWPPVTSRYPPRRSFQCCLWFLSALWRIPRITFIREDFVLRPRPLLLHLSLLNNRFLLLFVGGILVAGPAAARTLNTSLK